MSDWTDNRDSEVSREQTSEPLVTPPPEGVSSTEKPAYTQADTAAPAQESKPAGEWRSEPSANDTAAAPETQQPISSQGSPVQQTAAQSAADWHTPGTAQPMPQQPVKNYTEGWYRRAGTSSGQPDSGNIGGAGGSTPPPAYTGWYMPQSQPPKKKHTGVIVVLAVIGCVVALCLAVLIGIAVYRVNTAEPQDEEKLPSDSQVVDNNVPSLHITDWADDDGGLSAAEIIERNLDSTVLISLYQMRSSSALYYYGFGSETLMKIGDGSGIVMSKDGYIITNWHVVVDEDTGKVYDKIDVTTHDGKLYENAKVIGADKSTDLAVIKIDAADLSVAEFGDSSKLVMGARVVALGNASGLHWSASQGIVSGLARDVYEDTGYAIKCLQTDTAINFGNSGGPLLNNQGQVIGINSAKIAAEGYEGLGFSIPINEAKVIIDDLLKYGYVKGRVELGITGYTVNGNGYKGFAIKSIDEDSVLVNTKARAGDLITAIDGQKIRGYDELRSTLAKHAVGDSITLSLLRLDPRTGAETTFTVTVTLAESKN